MLELSDLYERAFGCVPVEEINAAWFIEALTLHRRLQGSLARRCFDVVVASVAAVMATPLMLLVARDNPNSYDVAIRAVRGQVILAGMYTLPVDFRAQGNGVWLRAGAITKVAVPVDIPVQLAIQLVQSGMSVPTITYRFIGRADVTATSTFQLEKDDYSVNEWGIMTRQQLAAALGWGF